MSLGGRITLVKDILEAILVYYFTMDFVPKGVLESTRKKYFEFLWARKKERDGIPLVNW
jgi:hypothetical protein